MKREKLTKFYSQYRSYIFPAIVVLSSLFLIVFVIFPQTVKLIDNQKAIGALIIKSEFLNTKVTALESYNEEDLSRQVGFVLAALPPDKDFGDILGLLQQVIVRSGFSIGSISFSNAGGHLGNSASFEVKLEIKGAKIAFQTLLNNLENLPRIIRISSIDISSNQITQAIDVALAVEVLYSPLPQNFGGADSPLPELSQKDNELLAKLAGGGGVVSSPSAIQAPRGKSNPFE